MFKITERLIITLICYGLHYRAIVLCTSYTKSIEEYEDDKNSMISIHSKDDSVELYDDFYNEFDNWMDVTDSLNVLFFGPSASFLRLDVESLLHVLIHTRKNLVPISKVLLAWDMVTDGKTAAFLQGRELLAFGPLLNVVPEEDLYYINFGDRTVLSFFAREEVNLSPRKLGIMVTAYKRYFGPYWYKNATYINDLGYLLCGFPASDFEEITPEVYKEISVESLNKLYKCGTKQSKVLYNLATNNLAYGKPYQWSSHEVNRMGMLITYIPKVKISSIQLEAISAISPEVMKEMAQSKLEYFTKQQTYSMNHRALRIFILRMMLRDSQTMSQQVKASRS